MNAIEQWMYANAKDDTARERLRHLLYQPPSDAPRQSKIGRPSTRSAARATSNGKGSAGGPSWAGSSGQAMTRAEAEQLSRIIEQESQGTRP